MTQIRQGIFLKSPQPNEPVTPDMHTSKKQRINNVYEIKVKYSNLPINLTNYLFNFFIALF